MTTALNAELAHTWVSRWDAQQESYVPDREERFAVIGDVVEHTLAGQPGTVLDLGCGPGSLAGRLAARLKGSQLIGLDSDPLLLAMARATYGDQVKFVDADLTTQNWPDQVPERLAAAVATTALHWLAEEPLAALYRTLAAKLRPGGVFVDGDHHPLGDQALDGLLTEVQRARKTRAGVTDNEDWSTWWDAAHDTPALAELMDERSARAIAHHGSNHLTIGQEQNLLRAAGFRSVGTVWQSGDDFVLVAIR
jgi:SAM-dependent methyltransferase